MSEWISVADHLPIDLGRDEEEWPRQYVLTFPHFRQLHFADGRFLKAHVNEEGWGTTWEVIDGVSHWMPLPDPPTEADHA